MDWMQFLSGTPARDYVYQETPYEEQVRRAAGLLNRADAVLKIGKDPFVFADLCCICFLSLKASSDNQNHAM